MDVRAGLGVVTVGVLAGEIGAATWVPPPAALLVAPAVACVLWLATGRRRGLAWAVLAVAALVLGAARMHGVTSPVLPAAHVARLRLPLATVLEGRIVAAPERRAGRTVLLVEAAAVGRGAARRPVCGLVRLALRHPARRWRYGERLRVETRLRAPRNFENPGRFDYLGHLARQGVLVTASAWNGDQVERLPGRARGLRARLERWRERLAAAMAAAVPPPEGAVLRALIVGDEEGIDADLREAFTRAGVVHLLSISGLHVGLVAAASFWLARRLLGRSERLLLAVDVERLAALLSLGPVALYTALAGLGGATLRSAIMGAAAVLAGLLGRRAGALPTLALAARAPRRGLAGVPVRARRDGSPHRLPLPPGVAGRPGRQPARHTDLRLRGRGPRAGGRGRGTRGTRRRGGALPPGGARALAGHRARARAGKAGLGGRRRAHPEPARAGARLRAPRGSPP